MRVPSDHPMRNGGYRHLPGGAPVVLPPQPPDVPTIDAPALACQYIATMDHGMLMDTARRLGVSDGALVSLWVGYSVKHKAVTFPMRDGCRVIVGIRLRSPEGRKWAVTGSREGLFIPDGRLGSPLFICEGPTDTAALLTLGLCAVGRPSCRGAVEHVKALLGNEPRRTRVVLVSDRDKPGLAGCQALADALGLPVRFLVPPSGIKDVRKWVNLGAKRHDMMNALVPHLPAESFPAAPLTAAAGSATGPRSAV